MTDQHQRRASRGPTYSQGIALGESELRAVRRYADLYDLTEEEALGALAREGIDSITNDIEEALKL